MSIKELCKIEKNALIAQGVYDMTLTAPGIAAIAAPGQFLHIACGPATTLRRPVSICDADGERVRIVFEVKGAGTEYLASLRPGDTVDVLGPLGNGFAIPEGSRILVVGGGMGTPPMLFLARGRGADAVLAFRSADRAVLVEDFTACCQSVSLLSDDGSLGKQGYAVKGVMQAAQKSHYDFICACGPKAMLKTVADMARMLKIKCLVSLEERMGCGVGACLTCSCKIKAESGFVYRRVCKDGPVFDGEEVLFDG